MNLCPSPKVMVVLLMTALAVPIAAEQIFGTDTPLPASIISTTAAEVAAEVREQATGDKALLRRQRRQYWQAIDQYRNLVRDGVKGLVAPTPNDAESIEAYIRGDVVKAQGSGAQASSVTQASSLLVQNLSETDRHLLRWYSKTNTCPVSLKGYIPGFYELCLTVTKDAAKQPRVGLLNDLQTTRAHSGAPKATTKLRLEMLKQAYDRTNRRTDIAVPGRPTSSSAASTAE
ncbi:TPA: hypothetical protein DCL30_02555 [Candidatus Peribacteria bacterium]|nr:MAG: hypothetical protein A3J91_04940 [Candidatus Peribacteria bacterium RIFOXYC2_FULL_58_10]OGJ85130.1 MAG: hypothetical protein A2529_01535 [Candidatus Peribacteria bacterium RIFOXYD2_FULL_58_15]HAI98403.1 hypothetical protein [Candidatus Peribacteria bacterium]HAS33824.1 hypothetical protein [Candidatus Peribacteria bacterium]